MSRSIPGNSKHLTLSDRIYIEKCLNEGRSFKEIAKYLCKDPSTISREVKKHNITSRSYNNSPNNFCAKKSECREINVCNSRACLGKKCLKCNQCYKHCRKFEPNFCYKRLYGAPYVCNGCHKKEGCRQNKRYYRAANAEKEYKDKLKECREGVNLTPEELERLNSIVSPLIEKGQPLFHICENNKDEIRCSIKTIYNYVNGGVLSVKPIHLRRAVKYKKRYRSKNRESNIPKKARIGRTLTDMADYLKVNPDLVSRVVQMDTVMGCAGSKQSLLTLFFVCCNIQISYILDEHTAGNVGDVFDYLEMKLGTEVFKKIFPLIETDNGPEFSDPDYLETASDGSRRTRIYYCDPYSSWQKAECEKNHEFIRYVIPKGRSMDKYTQADINKLMNNINSVSRESLNGFSPYDAGLMFLGKDVIDALGIVKIPANEICLNESLLK